MKKPFLTLAQAREIAAQYPTPFHIYDEAGIRRTARALLRAFDWNPGFREYYAVKAAPNPILLQILREEGCGVDCSSYTELELARAVGFSGQEIMFSSNVTPSSDYLLAHELEATLNLDDASDVEVVSSLFPLPKTMSLRFNPGGLFAIGNDIMDHPAEAKYGMTKEQLLSSIRVMQQRGVQHFGIHSFLASNTLTNEYYPALAEILFRLAVEVHEQTGAHIAFLNLSGGIGIPYRPEETENDIFTIGQKVRLAYEKILVPAGMELSIYTELGRYMTGPHGALVATAIHEKKTYKDYIGLDACAANLMRPAMYGAYHHITIAGKENEPCDHTYDITGSLCENNDKFAIDRKLPKIDIGDRVIIHDTGAHGSAMGFNYNGKLWCAELLLHEDGSVELIRRAETLDDYFATLKYPGSVIK